MFGFLGYSVLILQAGLSEQEEFSASTTWPRSDNPTVGLSGLLCPPSKQQVILNPTTLQPKHKLMFYLLTRYPLHVTWDDGGILSFFVSFSLAKGNIILSYHLMWTQRDKKKYDPRALFLSNIAKYNDILHCCFFFPHANLEMKQICLFVCLFLTKKRTISSGTVQCHNVVPPRL